MTPGVPILPNGSSVSAADLLKVIAQAHTRLGCDDFVEVCRLSFAPSTGDGSLMVTSTRVGTSRLAEEDQRFELPGLEVVRQRRSLSSLVSDGSLAAFIGLESEPTLASSYSSFSCSWHASRDPHDPHDDSPGWHLQSGGQSARSQWPPLGDGPYVSSFLPGRFFNSFSDLAIHLLHVRPGDVALHSAWPINLIEIADHRGRIAGIERTERGVCVAVEPTGVHWLAAEYQDLDGIVRKQHAQVEDGRAMFVFEREPSDLRLDLYLETDERVDQFQERQGFSSWGESVLLRHTRWRLSATVAEAIECGESERIEFKHSTALRFDATGTGRELLKSVAAFANTVGGSVFLGITDEGQVVGCDDILQKSKRTAGQYKTSQLRARDELYRWIAEEIRQRIDPVPRVTSKWHDTQAGFVLELVVARGDDTPYELHETHGFYVRLGGTNRLMTRDQLESRFRKRTGQEDSPL